MLAAFGDLYLQPSPPLPPHQLAASLISATIGTLENALLYALIVDGMTLVPS
jgi:hypothetical protein